MNYALEDDRKSLENITLDLYIVTHTLTHSLTDTPRGRKTKMIHGY